MYGIKSLGGGGHPSPGGGGAVAAGWSSQGPGVNGESQAPLSKANTGTGRRTFEQLDRAGGDVDDLRTRAARRGICCAVGRDGSGAGRVRQQDFTVARCTSTEIQNEQIRRS